MRALGPLQLADGSAPARQQTQVELAWDERGLKVVFTCEDLDAWGTFERRDDPIWQQEAVEVFLAVGAEDPKVYYEVELSPKAVLFDARVENPNSRREDMVVDVAWNWPGIEAEVRQLALREDWQARLFLPWQGLGGEGPPPILRANFYRIERPRQGEAEFSCWSPTLTSPPDFHKPARFGTLYLEGLAEPGADAGSAGMAFLVPRRKR